jgi:hypothetical protein
MHLAMPERQIPVLIEANEEQAEGFVPSRTWSSKRHTNVRRLLPSFVDGLRRSGKRQEIENEYGKIRAEEWNRLRGLLRLIDRVNAGDWSPIMTPDVTEALGKALEHLPALLDRLSPAGWFMEDAQNDGEIRIKSASGDVHGQITFNFKPAVPSKPSRQAATSDRSRHDISSVMLDSAGRKGETILQWSGTINGEWKTLAFALSEAFTVGLSKTRFVVWWHKAAGRFVPGLFCPDIATALYALAMWSAGTAGGWAICQKCRKDFARKRTKQLYCSPKCQTAAAMSRMRLKRKQENTSNSRTVAVSSNPKAKHRSR